ncbi:alpha/beta hydrolase [Candidatus Woesearchaeota archaeon]|nr:MAG: alpha/beta hydrolase [Candidatus Woesearchaeota archaeon]
MKIKITLTPVIMAILLVLLACAQNKQATQNNDKTKTEGEQPFIAYNAYYAKESAPGIILLHQLGGKKEDWHQFALFLQKKGYNVIAPDLPGHGESQGDWREFSEQDFRNMTFAVEYAKEELLRLAPKTKDIAIIGASVGANLALTYAAQDQDIKTVIALSPGLDFRGIRPLEYMDKIKQKVLLVASEDDPYSLESARELAKKGKLVELVRYERAGHGIEILYKDKRSSILIQEWLINVLKLKR